MLTQTEEIAVSKEMTLDLMDVLASAADLEAGAPLAARRAVDVAFRSVAYSLIERLRAADHPGARSALARLRDAAAEFSPAAAEGGGALTGEGFDDDAATEVAEAAHRAFMEAASAAGILARAERAARVPGLEFEGMCSR